MGPLFTTLGGDLGIKDATIKGRLTAFFAAQTARISAFGFEDSLGLYYTLIELFFALLYYV